MAKRQRNFRKNATDYTGKEFKHGIVIEECDRGYWKVDCKHCGEMHIYETRAIRKNSHTKKCKKQHPHNWTGLSRRDNIFRNTYGITEKEAYKLLEFQGGACALCNKKLSFDKYRGAFIDHCHDSGAVRGILCSKCNTALGRNGDNISKLKDMLYYLENNPYEEFLNMVTHNKE